jgi:N-acetylglucosaminyldiphosphoundecaprenol N-acetyl-beta-D-mannosaminyltransferase
MLVSSTSQLVKKVDLFGINYAVVDYHLATDQIIEWVEKIKEDSAFKQGYGVTALAVHGLIEGYRNDELKQQINSIDLIMPDGQPIRWAMNWFYKTHLKDRVYGPTLALHVLHAAAEKNIPVFFYGSQQLTLNKLRENLLQQFPNLKIVGMQADRFRESTEEEKALDRQTIISSGAKLVFVGRGCPRQERWVAENKDFLPAVLLAVGAAFDFHAGTVKQAPSWIQQRGLEWLYRLVQEPGRLWKRYLTTNSYFLYLFFVNALKKNFKV